MSDFFPFILVSFAVYRVARMVVSDDGPFDVFAELRSRIDPKQMTWVGRGLNCPLCVGFWVALLGAIIINHWEWWLGIAGMQTLLQKLERE